MMWNDHYVIDTTLVANTSCFSMSAYSRLLGNKILIFVV